MKFKYGSLCLSMGINNVIAEKNDLFMKFVMASIGRHLMCDWGDMCIEDKNDNDFALKEGGRLFSGYNIPAECGEMEGEKIWIITEHDRSATTVLFPFEY